MVSKGTVTVLVIVDAGSDTVMISVIVVSNRLVDTARGYAEEQ
jgi:hypothetical protein